MGLISLIFRLDQTGSVSNNFSTDQASPWTTEIKMCLNEHLAFAMRPDGHENSGLYRSKKGAEHYRSCRSQRLLKRWSCKPLIINLRFLKVGTMLLLKIGREGKYLLALFYQPYDLNKYRILIGFRPILVIWWIGSKKQ